MRPEPQVLAAVDAVPARSSSRGLRRHRSAASSKTRVVSARTRRRSPRSPAAAAAGGVDQPAAGLHQTGRRRQDRTLLAVQLGHGLRRLAPLQVGIAAQGADARARRIDEHAVDLAGQALDPSSRSWRSAAGSTFDRPERFSRGVEPASRFAERRRRRGGRCSASRAEGQRLATRAGAEVDHHLAALGVEQKPSSWLPSSWTSTGPRVNASSFASAGLPSTRRPRASTASPWRRCPGRQAAP